MAADPATSCAPFPRAKIDLDVTSEVRACASFLEMGTRNVTLDLEQQSLDPTSTGGAGEGRTMSTSYSGQLFFWQ